MEFLLSPLGIFGLIAVNGWILVASRSLRLTLWSLSFPLFISTLGKYRYIKASYVVPLNYAEEFSRPMFIVLLTVLVITSLLNRSIRSQLTPERSACLFFAFQIHFSLLMILNGVENGLLSTPVYAMSFVAMMFVLKATREASGKRFLLESLVLGGVLFTGGCMYQLLLAPHNAVWAGRFIGITNNSVHTAQFLALFIRPTVYLTSTTIQNVFLRNALWLCIAVQFALLAYTGSRTGILMTLLPLVVMYRQRSRHLMTAGVAFSVALLLTVVLFPEAEGARTRLTSTEDTRSAVYQILWQQFLDSPVFGDVDTFYYQGVKRLRVRENSYLMVAATMGFVGIAIFGAFLVTVCKAMQKLYSYPNPTGRPQFRDFVLASLVSILAGAFFEGFLFAIVGPCYLLLYLYASMAEDLAREPLPRDSRIPARPLLSQAVLSA